MDPNISHLKLNILSLEDSIKDFEIIHELLIEAGCDLKMDRVDNEKDFIVALKTRKYQLILADFNLPAFDAIGALQRTLEICPETPFIVVSGSIGEITAIELIKQGAVDYVLKDKPERLPFSIKRALSEAHHKDALRESEFHFSTLADSGKALIWTSDSDKKCNYFNLPWLKFTGRTLEQELGDGWAEGVHPDDIQNCIDTYHEAFDKRQTFSIEYRIHHHSGEYRWIQDDGTPRYSTNGTFLGYIGHCLDITERKKIQTDLTNAKNKAEESDRLKTAFLHNISHEIRTPMNAIIGFSEFLTTPLLDEEKCNLYTDIIIQSSNQLLSIITDIIKISTIEAGQEQLNEGVFDLNAAIKLVYNQFLSKAENQKVSLEYTLGLRNHEDLILSDETKIMGILSNLIANSLKFTNKGSVSFGYSLKKNELEFFVIDTGIGIPEEMHQEIFKRFSQVESTISRQFGGSGLGLSISKAYVELLGGKIWLLSEPGKGAAFYFTLPYKKAGAAHSAFVYDNRKSTILLSIKTILVAEDEDSNFLLLKEILSNEKIELIWAKNGRQAIEISQSNPNIDLVLMDIKMPEIDGYDATKQIKKIRPGLPIIVQTSYTTSLDMQKALSCGSSDFISKPIKKDLLLYKIHQLLGE